MISGWTARARDSQQITAAGGTPPYSFAVTAGTLAVRPWSDQKTPVTAAKALVSALTHAVMTRTPVVARVLLSPGEPPALHRCQAGVSALRLRGALRAW